MGDFVLAIGDASSAFGLRMTTSATLSGASSLRLKTLTSTYRAPRQGRAASAEPLARSNGDHNGEAFGSCATMTTRTCQSERPAKIDLDVDLKAAGVSA